MTIPRSLRWDSPPARVLDGAADLLESVGLNHGRYWPDDQWWAYKPGQPCDVVGAIAVTLGVTAVTRIEEAVAPALLADCHPAVAAVIDHLKLATAQDLVIWSDGHTQAEAVAALRACAAHLDQAGVQA